MEPLNNLIWNDEDENENGIMPTAAGDPPMPQICSISESTCYNEGSGDPPSLYNGSSATTGSDYCGC